MEFSNWWIVIGVTILELLWPSTGSSWPGCQGLIRLTSPSGTITSPQYPSNYPVNVHCTWEIRPNPKQAIMVIFEDLDVEGDAMSCPYDFLRMSANKWIKYCGKNLPAAIITNSSVVLLEFTSDSTKTGRGFKIAYRPWTGTTLNSSPGTPKPVIPQGCAGNPMELHAPNGVVSSPGFDGQKLYQANLDCSWVIKQNTLQVLTLTFLYMDIESENATGCKHDRLQVFNGTTERDPLLGTFCGNTLPTPLSVQTSEVLLRFETDNFVNGIGFKLEYKVNPQEDDACGVPAIRPSLASRRIVGGRVAVPHSWPWQVMFRLERYGHYCGGALIDPHWVLTAAHCFYDFPQVWRWQVIVGKHLKNSYENVQQTLHIQKIIPHPDYDYDANFNDIALVQLGSPAVLKAEVTPVCLPRTYFSPGTICYITGFGDTKGTGGEDSLKQAAVPIVPPEVCNGTNIYDGALQDTAFCAGFVAGGADACQGDSGGPLVCTGDSGLKFFLYGITSWGATCGGANQPGVYTNVFDYLDWVKNTTKLSTALQSQASPLVG